MTMHEKLIGLAAIAARTSVIGREYMLQDLKQRLLYLLDDVDRELDYGKPGPPQDCLAEPLKKAA
jgi:hypothetical protein